MARTCMYLLVVLIITVHLDSLYGSQSGSSGDGSLESTSTSNSRFSSKFRSSSGEGSGISGDGSSESNSKPKSRSKSRSKSSSSSEQSTDTVDICGEVEVFDAPEQVVESCYVSAGVLQYGSCSGGCASDLTIFRPDLQNYGDVERNCSCCGPVCFEQVAIELECTGETRDFSYFLPTKCGCLGCDDAGKFKPNIWSVEPEDNDPIEVYFDGIRQIPLAGFASEESSGIYSRYWMDRCNKPNSNVTLVTSDADYDGFAGIAAADNDGLITDSSWFCSQDGSAPVPAPVFFAHTVDGKDAFVLGGSGPLGFTISCTKHL